MDAKTRDNLVQSCMNDFVQYRLSSALETLSTIVHYCINQELKTKAESLAENYKYMISFLSQGNVDAKAAEIQDNIMLQGLEVLQMANRDIRLSALEDTYAKTHRQLIETYGDPKSSLLNNWNALLSPDEQHKAQSHLFYFLWTSGHWTSRDTTLWYDFLSRQTEFVVRHLLGGIFLSIWEYPDAEKLTLLKEISSSADSNIQCTAAVYLLLLAQKYRNYPLLLQIAGINPLDKMLSKYIYRMEYAILLIHWTLLMNKEEEDEIGKFSDCVSEDMVKQFMEKKVKFYRKMLSHNLDANLSSRVYLYKTTQFTKEISNWFLPFDKDSNFVQNIITDDKGKQDTRLLALINNNLDCDLDKYALLSMLQNKKNMDIALSQIEGAEVVSEKAESRVMPYDIVRILYRFFEHSMLKDELQSPFAWSVLLWDNPQMQDSFGTNECIEVCKVLLHIKRTSAALRILNKLMDSYGADTETLILAADCEMTGGNFRKALVYLKQAELLEEDNVMLLGKIQQCYRELGMFDDQIQCLRRMEELCPDDINNSILLVEALNTEGRYKEELEVLFKIDYKKPDNPEVMKALTHCALHAQEYTIAAKYNNRLLQLGDYPQPQGLMLTSGHIHFLQGMWKEALLDYKQMVKHLKAANKYMDEMVSYFDSNSTILHENGLSIKDIHLMRDMIFSTV